MHHLSAIALCSLALCLGGCESMDTLSSRVHDRFEPAQPQTRVFEADRRPVFDATQIALKRMDFTVTKAGMAQGIVKAISQIQPAAGFGNARQYSFEVNIEDLAGGKTQVSALLREQKESSSFAGATDIPLREHGLYDSFFAALTQALTDKLPPPAQAR